MVSVWNEVGFMKDWKHSVSRCRFYNQYEMWAQKNYIQKSVQLPHVLQSENPSWTFILAQHHLYEKFPFVKTTHVNYLLLLLLLLIIVNYEYYNKQVCYGPGKYAQKLRVRSFFEVSKWPIQFSSRTLRFIMFLLESWMTINFTSGSLYIFNFKFSHTLIGPIININQ